MPTRPSAPLPFGDGLDRDTGSMVVAGTAQEDLRNVHLTAGMALVIPGLAVIVADLLDPDDDARMDTILAGDVLKAENAGIVVAYRESTRAIHVYRVTRAATSPIHVGIWFVLAADAVTPPIVRLAEVSGLMFLAHGEPAIASRAATAYYDPDRAGLFPLVAPWAHATTIDPTGTENALRFQSIAALGTVVTVAYVDPGSSGAPLTISVAGSAITVHLATDGGSAITSTAADILAAIQADDDASALVTVGLPGNEDGSGIVTAIAPVTLHTNDGIRFRGVTEHLGAYLAGWGYGTDQETRPDYVRLSLPGIPTTFQLKYYESIGQIGDAVLCCLSTGLTLLCYKSEETWNHFGTDRSNFGKKQLDPTVGILSDRLGVVVGSVAYVWTHVGPRMSNGGTPVDLAIPLALYAPAPADLAPEDDPATAFAVHLPDRKEIRFHFGRRFYAYSLVTQRWSYGEFTVAPTCGFLLPGGGGSSVSPGYVSDLDVESDDETP